MTISLFGWATVVSLSTLLSYKVVGTTTCYVLRCILEGSIIEELKTFVKYVLDFCYLGLVLIIFNLAKKQPNSAINDFLFYLSQKSSTMSETNALIFFMLIVFMIWVVAIKNCKRVNLITGNTNKDLIKKSFCFGISGFLSATLFSLGVLFQ